MAPGPNTSVLEDTITTTWHRGLAGTGPDGKRHWRTKMAYYEAVGRRLEAHCGDELTWRSIVDAVEPHGSRTTFYEVTGPNAKHPLMGAFRACPTVEAMQFVLVYRRSGAVDQLIDEVKVWSYWRHREGLLARLRISPGVDAAAAAVHLIASVVDWARQHPQIAAALGYAPPMCAVEDLMLLKPGQLSVITASVVLGDAMRGAIETVDAPGGPSDSPVPDALLAGLAAQIDAIGREAGRHATAEAGELRRRAAGLMLDAALALI